MLLMKKLLKKGKEVVRDKFYGISTTELITYNVQLITYQEVVRDKFYVISKTRTFNIQSTTYHLSGCI